MWRGCARSVERVRVVIGQQVMDAFGGVGLLLVEDAIEAIDVLCESVSWRGAGGVFRGGRDEELFDANLVFASVACGHECKGGGAMSDVLGNG